MASVTRVNGLGHAHATIYSTANLGFAVVACGASVAGKGGIGSTIEAVAQQLQPIAINSEGTAGLVNIVYDASQTNAAWLQVQLQALGTVDSIDLSAATVTEGGQFIVAA
ncbi:MAG: hypothetical protein ACKVJK_17915 [Methylophagaceae bacterium]|jgi:hypothetical protein|tara:strand:+ start:872 stop:1201 length:330 start_codon:yes stop_codon:yes gene_type:complete